MTDNSNDKSNFPNKLLLTNTKVSMLFKAFANNPSADIKLSKTQLYEIEQSGGFLSWTFRTITKNWFTFNEKCT